MTLDKAKKIIKSECYIADLLNLDRTRMVNTALDTVIEAAEETRWIPCSERLPEEYGEYLITWTTSQSKKSYIAICECEITNEYDYEYDRFNVEWVLDDYIEAYRDVEVIAWLPLPQPYKAEGSDEE